MAAVLHEYGESGQLKYQDWDDPQIGNGQILIRVTAAEVSAIDEKLSRGTVKEFFLCNCPRSWAFTFRNVVMVRDL